MNTSKPISAYTYKSLVEKLRPSRFPEISGKMAAILGYVLGANFIDPAIEEISVKTDGSVMARVAGYGETKRVIGNYPKLLREWLQLVAAAGLNKSEFIEAQSLFATKIGFYARETA